MKLAAFVANLSSFWLCSVSADWIQCLPPYPVGTTGGYCGPQEAPGVGLLDAWDFSYVSTRVSWCRWRPCVKTSTKVNKVSFQNVCFAHDNCYDAIYDDPTNCDGQIEACNNQFDTDLARQCSQLPQSCQRSLCRNLIASTFSDIVEATESYYREDAGC